MNPQADRPNPPSLRPPLPAPPSSPPASTPNPSLAEAGEEAKQAPTRDRGASDRSIGGVVVWPILAAVADLRRRRLFRDVAVLQVSNGAQRALGFGFSVVTARVLGVSGYGEYLLVLSLYSTLNLLGNLGVGQFLVVPLAQAVATGDREAIARGVGYILKFGVGLAVIIVAVVLGAGAVIGDLIMHRPDLGAMTQIVVAGVIPSVIYNVATTSLQSGRRMATLSIVEIVDLLVGRGCAVGFVLLGVAGGGVHAILWGTVVGGILSAAHAGWWYLHVAVVQDGFPNATSLVRAAIDVPVRAYFRFSAVASIDKNVAQLLGQLPLLLLGRYAPPEEAAYFGIAGKVFTLLASLHGGVSRALSVRLSQEMTAGGPVATRRLFWRSSLAWGGASAGIAAVSLAAMPIFRLVYGAEYLPSILLVAILGALQAKQGLTVALGTIYLIAGRVATNAFVKLPLFVVAVPMGVALVDGWGAIGAATFQLLLYLLGDVVYFSFILTPWFWRAVRPDATLTLPDGSRRDGQ